MNAALTTCPAIKVRYRLNLRELVEFNRFSLYRGMVRAGIGLALVAVGFGWLFGEGWDSLAGGPIEGLFLFLFLATLILVLNALMWAEQWFAGLGVWLLGRSPEIQLEVDREGIEYKEATVKKWIYWAQVKRSHTTSRVLVLELGWKNKLALPKRCFEPTTWAVLLDWAKNKGPRK